MLKSIDLWVTSGRAIWKLLFRNDILLVWTLPYWWGNCNEDKNQTETEKGYCCNCEGFTQFCCSDYFYQNYPSSTQIIFLRIFFLRIAKAPFYKSQEFLKNDDDETRLSDFKYIFFAKFWKSASFVGFITIVTLSYRCAPQKAKGEQTIFGIVFHIEIQNSPSGTHPYFQKSAGAIFCPILVKQSVHC